MVLHVFGVAPAAPAEPERFPALLAALGALLDGRAEADGFNRLVLLRPWLWHTAGPGFGDRPENARFVYLMFFAAG